MPVTATEVTLRFRRPPHDVFGASRGLIDNELRFRICRTPRSPSRWRQEPGRRGAAGGRKEADALLPNGGIWDDPAG